MSGVAGVYRRDGSSVQTSTLEQVDEALRPRGPDGGERWSGPGAGLCHRLLQTTPEMTHGHLPLERDGLVITADARLDNRATLLDELNVTASASDGELLLAAYGRWGVHCPKHLLGAFAFAIWDTRNEQLFLVRDHMGIKPIAYADQGDVVVFASEPAVVTQHDAVSSDLDEQWIGEFLLGYFEDTERTVFGQVRRLPAGHYLVADSDGIRVEQYWELEIDKSRVPDTEEARTEKFRALFTDAVQSRLRGATPGGALLSGGLDSSSIVCTASKIQPKPLHTFSAYSDAHPESDEREYIDAVLAIGEFEPHFVQLDGISPLVDREHLLRRHGMPIRASNHFIHWELFRRANASGVRVVLDGLHGDTVVSTGLDRLPKLCSERRFRALASEVNGLANQVERGSRRTLIRRAVGPSAPATVRHIYRRLFGATNKQSNDLLHPTLAKRIDFPPEKGESQDSDSRVWGSLNQVQSGIVPYTVETVDRSAVAFDVEPRYPFLDKRLVEYCVSLPPSANLNNGWPRYILRNAMSTLPERVRWRPGKGEYGEITSAGLRHQMYDRVENILGPGFAPLNGYVAHETLQDRWDRLLRGDGDRFELWRALSLAEWLSECARGETP